MPFRPYSLPYQLRRLFDAGVLSPQDLARSVGVPVARVGGWLRGRTPDPVTRLQVGKVLSFYARRSEDRHLKLEDEETAPAIADRAERGVHEDTECFPGTNAYNVYRGDGARIGRWEAVAGVTDEELLAAFDGLLERKDSPLKMLPSSGQESS